MKLLFEVFEMNKQVNAGSRTERISGCILKFFPDNLRQFHPSLEKVTMTSIDGHNKVIIDVPNGIIAPLTRECGGKVHNHSVVHVTCGSVQQEACRANPQSGAYDNDPGCAR
jgi:hypothetical protein